jgi:hypothetical protein
VLGIASFYYLGIYHMRDTNYDITEEGAVVPNHILEKEGLTPGQELVVGMRGGIGEKVDERVGERESEREKSSSGEKV